MFQQHFNTMKNHLFLLTLSAALTAPLAPGIAAPAHAPKIAALSAQECQKRGSLLHYFDLVPAKHFAVFGKVNRRSLLKRKGAIVDTKRGYIEIPVTNDSRNGDVSMIQISLFGKGNEPWIGVSRIVWNQDRVPGTIDFYYGYNDAGGLRTAAKSLFPYTLGKRGGVYENALLPREGTTIYISIPETDDVGPAFTYRGGRFVESE